MCKRLILFMIVIGVLFLPSCKDDSAPQSQTEITIEDASFGYLRNGSERVRRTVQIARKQLARGETTEAKASMLAVDDGLKELLYYDIPITEARQLIYDAKNLYTLGRQKDSLRHLDRAEEILDAIAAHGNADVINALKNSHAIIDELQYLLTTEQSMYSSKGSVPHIIVEKFKELSQYINLLAIKSDLVLTGAHFLN